MEDIRPNDEVNGRYILKQSKGRGTFGEVWLAYDRATDGEVAIKFYVTLDSKGREEFIQEFRIAAKLHHANLLATKDYGEWHGHPYLTMMYCENGSAANLIGTLNPGQTDELKIWHFIHDVAAGLAYLHSVKPDPIVHQDIKPDNILVDSDGSYLITDFGISKRIRNTMRRQSTRALKAGAPAYMAPERFSEHPEPVLASDVWSLGVSIYELTEGELPFGGLGGNMMQNGAELPSLSPGWSKNLNDIMHWCLQKETWNRAKAYQVEKIAGTVLDTNNNVCVESLISQMKGNGGGGEKEDHEDEDNGDPHKTRRQANNVTSGSAVEDNSNSEETRPGGETFKRWKKTLPWVAASIIVLMIVVGIFVLPKDKTPEKVTMTPVANAIKRDSATEMKADTINVAKPETTTPPSDKHKVKAGKAKPATAISEKHRPAVQQSEPKVGTLSFGYATWTGDIKNGKPHGNGVMTFNTDHRIDSRDSSRRMAKAGERIDGTYNNGHLVEGRWYKSDGSTEYILLGE